jgi:hypothetical protein
VCSGGVMAANSLRVAWFTEVAAAGSRSLSAYCSDLLLPRVSTRHAIEVFSPTPGADAQGLPHHHFLSACRRHQEAPFDLFFYQLEDGISCRFVRGHIGLIPGVTWLHDLFFNDLGPEACHTSPWETSIQQFYDPREPFYDRAKAPHQLWPRAYREASLSPVTLFSSRWALREFSTMVSNRLESTDGSAQADLLPVPVASAIEGTQQQDGVFKIASASVPGIEGRGHKLFSVLKDLSCAWHLSWMIDPVEKNAACELLQEFGVEDCVTLVSPRTTESWIKIVAASDLALHLHTSPFGHLAPFVQLSLASGTPTVVSLSAQGEDLPANTAFQVVPGLAEGVQLREIIEGVRQNSASGSLGSAGQRYVLEVHEADRVANLLSDGFIEWAPHVGYVMDRWSRIAERAKQTLMSEVRSLVDRDVVPGISPFEMVIRPGLSR